MGGYNEEFGPGFTSTKPYWQRDQITVEEGNAPAREMTAGENAQRLLKQFDQFKRESEPTIKGINDEINELKRKIADLERDKQHILSIINRSEKEIPQ